MPELGTSAYTVASHSVMIIILIGFAVRSLRSIDGEVAFRAVQLHGYTASLALACMALGVERLYYISARLLRPAGIDLWSRHPAPEVLSLIVSTGLYAAMVPLILARAPSTSAALQRIAMEWVALAAVFLLVARALY